MSAVRAYILCRPASARLRSGVGLRVGAPRRRQRREGGVNRGREIVKTQKSKYHIYTELILLTIQINKLDDQTNSLRAGAWGGLSEYVRELVLVRTKQGKS